MMRASLLLWGPLVASLAVMPTPAFASHAPEIDAGFRLLYELRFEEARSHFSSWQDTHPDDPLGYSSLAASYLFEEFYHQGVLNSEFFLDDNRLLGGVSGQPDGQRRMAFLNANARAQELARQVLKADPMHPDALFALTMTTGMLADYAGIMEKRHLDSLRFTRQAETYAKSLLAVQPGLVDAYLTLGAANYIIGSLPAHKRFFLWFGGIHGDRRRGMMQLEMAAMRGHYLRPFAKILLALVALRENQPELARTLLEELTSEFPANTIFRRELALLKKGERARSSSPAASKSDQER